MFLTGSGALTTTCYPAAVNIVLTTVLVVLAGPGDPHRAAALGSLVDAFDSNGQPKTELRTPQPGRWELLLGQAGDSLDRYSRIATAVWTIFSFVAVTILIVTKHLDLTHFQLPRAAMAFFTTAIAPSAVSPDATWEATA